MVFTNNINSKNTIIKICYLLLFYMLNSSPIIELKNVAYSYTDERPVLTNMDFIARKGEVVALIGPSGCGKSTTLRLITGQLTAEQGVVNIFSDDISKFSLKDLYEMRKNFGMMFQFGAVFTDMSVFDNVAFPMREHTNLPEVAIRDLVLMKLQAVGLRGTHEMMPSELSGGMARRVALARAIALDPQIILYDEPFAGLDPISMHRAAELIRKLNDSLNACSVLVTHDIEEAMMISDYLYILFDGVEVAGGSPEEIRNHPNKMVQQFLKGKSDGPLQFHYPAPPLYDDFNVNQNFLS